MGAFSGPETADSGIVLALDAQNPLSVGNTSLNVWEDVVSSTTTVSSVGVITCLSIDNASSNFFGIKYTTCGGTTKEFDNRPPSIANMNTILETFLDCKPYQTGTYNSAGAVFGAYGNAGNVCTLRFTGFGVGAVIGVGGYFNAVTRQCRLTGDLQNSPVTITSPSGGFADPIVLTSDPADIQFSNPGSGGDPMYVYWLGPYNQVPYNTLRSSYGTLTNGPVFTQEPKLEPFGGAGAVQFDGSDYLEIPASSDFSFTTAPWTFECWVYHKDWTTGADGNGIQYMLFPQQSSHPTYPVAIQIHQGRYLILDSANYGSPWYSSYNDIGSYGTAASLNTWNHVAYTRDSSGVDRVFVNGTLQFSATGKTNTSSSISSVARFGGTGTGYINGFISNLRLIKGTALYTSNFTPPSRTLEPIENTVLLTCQGQNIKDASSNSHAITVNGDAKATIVSSSFEFDGSDDYVILSNFDKASYGTTNFSLSLWFNADSGSYKSLFQAASALSNTNPWIALISYSSGLRVYVNANYRIDVPYTQGAWNNFVLTFDSAGSGLWTAYLNGSSVGSYTGPIGNFSASGTYLGNAYNNSYFDGKISNFSVQQKTLTASEVKQNYNALRGRYA